MTLSSQQKQLQDQLLKDAQSHGPYLWTDQDVRNALLWFPSNHSAHRNNHGQACNNDNTTNITNGDGSENDGVSNGIAISATENAVDEADNDANNISGQHDSQLEQNTQEKINQQSINSHNHENEITNNEEGYEFLRRLIQARGIWIPRPPKLTNKKSNKRKSSMPIEEKTAAKGSGEKGVLNDGERKRKRHRNDVTRDHGDAKNNDHVVAAAAAAAAKSKGATKTLASAIIPKPSSQPNPPPLLSILMGYYQLHLPPLAPALPSEAAPSSSSTSSTTNNNGNKSSVDRQRASKSQTNDNKETNDLASSDSHESISCNDGNAIPTTECTECAEMASTKLLNDLSSIILARRHTQELYHALLKRAKGDDDASSIGNAAVKINGSHVSGKELTTPKEAARMSHCIDRYMTHPTTCLRRVYASNLYDRIMDICPPESNDDGASIDGIGHDVKQTIATSNHTGSNTKNTAVLHRFLQKLFGLAMTNVKIQEVVLLILLEPVRRLQVEHSRSNNCSSSRSMSPCDTSPNRTIFVNEKQSQLRELSQSQESQQQLQKDQSGGKLPGMELFPMLTTSLFTSTSSAASSRAFAATNKIINSESIERECSNPVMASIVQFILQTAKQTQPKEVDGTNATTKSSTNKHLISWWLLPSPLLCAVSQMYFPLACCYIRHLVNMAADGHDELYRFQHQSSDDGSSDESFQHAIHRMRQLCHTSHRLLLLATNVLTSMEVESQRYKNGMGDDIGLGNDEEISNDDDNSNDAFRKSLAWEAIHHAVFSSSHCNTNS